jgi:DNA-binding CsgD family transcriptional regulator
VCRAGGRRSGRSLHFYASLRAGASGFLLKDAGPGELLHAIRIVAAGEAMLAPSVTRQLIAEFAARPDPQTPPARLAELTEREREILQLVAAGLSNAEIARRLVISPLTAKTHVARILAKLDCHDRAQLVTLAYETGFVTPGAREAKTIDSPLAETLAPQQRQSSDERGHEAKAEGGASQRAASGGEPSAAGAPRSTSKSRTVVLESHCESQGRWEREHGAGDAGVEQERP